MGRFGPRLEAGSPPESGNLASSGLQQPILAIIEQR